MAAAMRTVFVESMLVADRNLAGKIRVRKDSDCDAFDVRWCLERMRSRFQLESSCRRFSLSLKERSGEWREKENGRCFIDVESIRNLRLQQWGFMSQRNCPQQSGER